MPDLTRTLIKGLMSIASRLRASSSDFAPPYHRDMSASMYESHLGQHERALERHRKAHADALKDVAKLERDIAGLNRQANSTRCDSAHHSHVTLLDHYAQGTPAGQPAAA